MPSRIIKPEDIKKIEHPFGLVYEISNRSHSSALNMALVQIRDDRKHYHKKATEIYYVLKGAGIIELNDKTFDISSGHAILVEPLTKHKARAFKGVLEIIVASSPPYDPEDEYYD
ncbi:MAG: cupin domain-containing protein [Candidatus Pacearchaeota archaeon]|nr:MAG: cupin domain-containing protein [Candidatus Pacearchaeota archaeon]